MLADFRSPRRCPGRTWSAGAAFAAWAVSSVVLCLTGAAQLRNWVGYRYRGRVRTGNLRPHVAVGVPNHLLTLTERLPALLVPVLGPTWSRRRPRRTWYPAWMLVWVAYMVPIQVGLVQFSEGVRRPGELRKTVRSGFASARSSVAPSRCCWRSSRTPCSPSSVPSTQTRRRPRCGSSRWASSRSRSGSATTRAAGLPVRSGGDRGGAGPGRDHLPGHGLGGATRLDGAGRRLGGELVPGRGVGRLATDPASS